MDGRMPKGTLRHWEKMIRRGIPMKTPKKEKICPELEEKLFEWIKAQRAKQLVVRRKDVKDQCFKLMKEMNIPSTEFKYTEYLFSL